MGVLSAPLARPPRPRHDSVHGGVSLKGPSSSPTLGDTRHCQGVDEAARRKETGEALGRGEHRRTLPAADPWTGAQQRVAVDAAGRTLYASLDPESRDGPHEGACAEAPSIRSLEASRRSPARMTPDPRKQRVSSLISACEIVATARCLRWGSCRRHSHALRGQGMTVSTPGALGGAVSIRVPSRGAVGVTERKETGEALGRGGASAHTSGGGSLDRGAAACGSRCSGSALYASLDPESRDGPHEGACAEAPSIRSLEASRRSPARMTPDPSKQRVSSLISAWAVSIRVPSHGAVCVTERKETGEALGRGGASAHTSGGGSLDRGAAACGSRCSGSALYASLDPESRDGPHEGACAEAPSIRSLEASRRSPARMTPDPSKQRVSSLISACEIVATARCLRRGSCRRHSHALRGQGMTVCPRWRLPEGAFVLPLRRWATRDTAKPGALGGAVSIRVPSHGAVCVTERKETGEALGRGGASAHTSGGGSLDRGAAACGSRCSGSALYASLDPEWRDGPHEGACAEAPSIRSLEASRRSPARMTPDPSKQRVSSLISACEIVATARCLRWGSCRRWSHALRGQGMTVSTPGALGGAVSIRVPSHGAVCVTERKETGEALGRGGASAHTSGGGSLDRAQQRVAVDAAEAPSIRSLEASRRSPARMTPDPSKQRVSSLISACEIVATARCPAMGVLSAPLARPPRPRHDSVHGGVSLKGLRPASPTLDDTRHCQGAVSIRVPSHGAVCVTERKETGEALGRGGASAHTPAADPWTGAQQRVAVDAAAGPATSPPRSCEPGALGGAVSIRVPSHGAVCVTERKETGEALGRGGASAHTSGGGSLDRGAAACGSRCSGSALYASLDPEWRDGPHDGACAEAPSIRSLEASRRSPARMTPDPSKQRVSSLISACEIVATARCLRWGLVGATRTPSEAKA
ncbi:MAG: hypothetical protein WDW38_010107 [Sanguina aurantia]